MKLRNKTTGEIVHVWEFIIEGRAYNSIKELKENYEDINPPEPLISDEKVRNVIRAWGELNSYTDVMYDKNEDCIYSIYGSDNTDTSVSISFDDIHVFDKLKHRKTYTIDELCGEEGE